ncbi:hypothetical protein P280DRAFT_472060 [Massarina eburnea CBS 473.64]|uniref:Uncharacterized protein n=1 Tax=Massarina eburnea CBS 473.64 TaxID=1395130 RepID=A0A6A6RRS7_9PLEO|nr:hypothetical protein P280DRAFT_472060 [Massarina eburnea CBS 473.64]
MRLLRNLISSLSSKAANRNFAQVHDVHIKLERGTGFGKSAEVEFGGGKGQGESMDRNGEQAPGNYSPHPSHYHLISFRAFLRVAHYNAFLHFPAQEPVPSIQDWIECASLASARRSQPGSGAGKAATPTNGPVTHALPSTISEHVHETRK